MNEKVYLLGLLLLVVGYFIGICTASHTTDNSLLPWDPLAKALRQREREIHARTRELVLRGYSLDDARFLSTNELEREAREETRNMKALGLDP